ncbi:hypothetical protein Hanom_Chr01g00053871 [Helianthus anomalus]
MFVGGLGYTSLRFSCLEATIQESSSSSYLLLFGRCFRRLITTYYTCRRVEQFGLCRHIFWC